MFKLKGKSKQDLKKISAEKQSELDAQAERFALQTSRSRRQAPRQAVYKTGSVVFPSGYKRECAIMDYSKTGMRLRFPNHEPLPPEVELMVPQMSLHVVVRVAWQDQTDAGVRYLRRVPPSRNKYSS